MYETRRSIEAPRQNRRTYGDPSGSCDASAFWGNQGVITAILIWPVASASPRV
jgi:hypothetical protein